LLNLHVNLTSEPWLIASRGLSAPAGLPKADTERDRQTAAVNNQAGGSNDCEVAEVCSNEMDSNPATYCDDDCTACDADERPKRAPTRPSAKSDGSSIKP